MIRRTAVVAFALACAIATPAFARHHRTHVHVTRNTGQIECTHLGCGPASQSSASAGFSSSAARTAFAYAPPVTSGIVRGGDPRPRSWCGWWLRHYLGVSDRALNLARNWARYGSPAGGPTVGAIVVWRSHVVIITGSTGSGWIVKSGNDDHAVRERERSLRGVIAFRTQ